MGGVTAETVSAAVERFQMAAVGQGHWTEALESLATLTGSTGAQLIGLGSETLVPFNVMTGMPPETGEDFVAAGGGDPAVNSRVRIGSRVAELQVLDESAFTTALDMRLNPAYADWIETYDMRHVCLTPLVKQPNELVGLALLRTRRDDNVDLEQKRAFEAVAHHARSAVRTRMALEDQGAQLLAGALEAVQAAAFFCDALGRVRGMTATAETLVAAGDVVRLTNGVLTTACEADRQNLEAALAKTASGMAPFSPVSARRLNSDDRVFIEAAPLPASSLAGLGPRVLIIVHGLERDQARLATAGRTLYGLTQGEAAVAALLATGRSPAQIAHARRVSIGTVRTQLRRIYDKTGATSQLALTTRLPRL